jgi:hypothetical protein
MLFPARAIARSFAAEMARGGRSCSLHNVRTGAIVARELEGAFTAATRRRGLLGRPALAPGTGLLIAPCSSVHTWTMQFAIDVIFVARDGRVRKVVTQLQPWRLAFGIGSFAVVELPAGSAAPSDTRKGDTLVIQCA